MIKNANWPRNLIVAVFGEEVAMNFLKLDAWLSHLSERERVITLKRYRDGMTLEAIGKEYQITRERVRQVEHKALRRLRHPSNSKDVLMISLEEHEAAIAKAEEKYTKLLAEHTALRHHVKELHEAIAEELPALKGIFHVMSNELMTGTVPDIPIEDLELSVRSHACLARYGIKTAREVERMTMDEIQKVRNLGLKSVDEIRGKLIDSGFEPKF